MEEFERLQKAIASNLEFHASSFDDAQLKKIYSYLGRLIEAEKKYNLSVNVVDDFIEKIGTNLSARTSLATFVKSLDLLGIKDERVSRIQEVLSRVKSAKEEVQIEEIA